MELINFLKRESDLPYFQELLKFIDFEYNNYQCYPKKENIFIIYKSMVLEEIKAVIIGQDPYHNENEADGFAFSTNASKLPPSLKNIYKELESDLGEITLKDGNLHYLVKNGVMLLNTILSVRKNLPLSHQNKGYEILTDKTIKFISENTKKVVFILMGNNAISKKELIDTEKHCIICCPHPSPLSAYRGFFGSKIFSRTNQYLIEFGRKPIEWIKKVNK